MKKLFLVLSSLSLIGVSSVIPTFMNQTNKSKLIDTQVEPIQINIKNKKIDLWSSDRIDFRTDPINLTSLGIKDKKGLHQYTNIELPGFKVSFLNGTWNGTNGSTWGAKMSEGEGDYLHVTNIRLSFRGQTYRAIINRKHSLWYDSNGNYNLALVYRLWCYNNSELTEPTPLLGPGNIAAELGDIVKFY